MVLFCALVVRAQPTERPYIPITDFMRGLVIIDNAADARSYLGLDDLLGGGTNIYITINTNYYTNSYTIVNDYGTNIYVYPTVTNHFETNYYSTKILISTAKTSS